MNHKNVINKNNLIQNFWINNTRFFFWIFYDYKGVHRLFRFVWSNKHYKIAAKNSISIFFYLEILHISHSTVKCRPDLSMIFENNNILGVWMILLRLIGLFKIAQSKKFQKKINNFEKSIKSYSIFSHWDENFSKYFLSNLENRIFFWNFLLAIILLGLIEYTDTIWTAKISPI